MEYGGFKELVRRKKYEQIIKKNSIVKVDLDKIEYGKLCNEFNILLLYIFDVNMTMDKISELEIDSDKDSIVRYFKNAHFFCRIIILGAVF